MTASKEMVGIAKSQPRKNQSQCLHLPQNYVTTGEKSRQGKQLPPPTPPLAQGLDPPLITTIFSVVE